MSFPRYERYKDSGIEWLGEVPEHWDIRRLKYVANIYLSNVDKHIVDGQKAISLCNYLDVYKNSRITSEIEFMRATASKEQIDRLSLQNGDVIITKDSEDPSDIGVPALVVENISDLVCGYHLAIIRPTASVGYFLNYLFQSTLVRSEFEVEATGMTRYALGKYSIENLALAIPQLKEQQTIAAFLDRETAKIDGLIAEQQRLIELLKEKRQAVISHAVTKGLNPDAPMKDSGIEWLGEVPEHWNICHLKRMTKNITDGSHISPETENGIYEFISTKDVSDDGIDFNNCLRTSEESYKYLVRTGCKPFPGDVLFSKDGTIGRTVVVTEDRDFVVASSLIIIRPDDEAVTPDFLNFLCQSGIIIGQVESFVKGAGLPRLSIQNLLKIIGVFPPISEQQLIVDRLNLVLGQMTSLLSSALDAITLLQERRTALISAAVTGKIDVRGLAETQPEREAAA